MSSLNWYHSTKNCTICTSKLNCFKLNFDFDAKPEFKKKYNAICLREFNCNLEDFVLCDNCYSNCYRYVPVLPNVNINFFDSFEILLSKEECLKILGE